MFPHTERSQQPLTPRRVLLAASCSVFAVAGLAAVAVSGAPLPGPSAITVAVNWVALAETRAITWNLCGSVCWKRGADGSQYPNVDFRGETKIRASKVAKAVKAHRATVLFTQETCSGQFTAILGALGPGWYGSFKRSSNSGNCKNGSTKVGLGIYTKGPHAGYRYTLLDTDADRNWFLLCVTWSGVDLCTVHIRAFVTNEVKFAEMAKVRDAAALGPGPTIIGGDFNLVPGSAGLRLIEDRGFREVDERDNEVTSPGSVYKIDDIYVQGARAVDGDSASYGPGSISDHRMLRGVIHWS